MKKVRRVSIIEQTTMHLREGLRSGRWRGELPGVLRLADECAVSKGAIREALHLLEKEGLVSAGRAGGRRTTLSIDQAVSSAKRTVGKPRAVRIVILLRVPLPEENAALNEVLRDIQSELVEAGHTVDFASKTQTDLAFDPARICRFVKATPADAWIVPAAPRPVLECFSAQSVPAIAVGGRSIGLEIAGAGVDGTPGLCAAAKRLIELGHRRPVLICARPWRQPTGGRSVLAFTEELARHGIVADDFHIPDFEPTPAALHSLFATLFRVTPPTALILEDSHYAIAALSFLAQRKLAVPRDVSLVCLYPDTQLDWCSPPMARLRNDGSMVARRVIRWCHSVALGKADHEQTLFSADFEEGGTIAPVRVIGPR